MCKSLFIFILLYSYSFCLAQNKNIHSMDDDISKIINLTYNLKFDEALVLIHNNIDFSHSKLQWKYLKGMVLFRRSLFISQNVSMGNIKEKQHFNQLLESSYSEFLQVARIGDSILTKNPNDTLALFFTGAAYGYIGLYHANKGDLFKAASEGKKGINYHDKLIKLEPTINDTYLSKGIFNFYTSNVPWYLKPILWILGKIGSEDKALKYLIYVSEHGILAKFEAMEFLTKLYIRQDNNELAKETINKLIAYLPKAKYFYLLNFANEFILYEKFDKSTELLQYAITLSKKEKITISLKETIGYIYIRLAMNYKIKHKYRKTISILQDLIHLDIAPEYNSISHLVIGNSYEALNEKNSAKDYFNWVVNNSKNINHQKKAKERLSKLLKK